MLLIAVGQAQPKASNSTAPTQSKHHTRGVVTTDARCARQLPPQGQEAGL